MNPDDESILSAFLDDELDPDDRSSVAWAVESSPSLAARLRDLASARDLVAELPRPEIPVDLSRGIEHLGRRRRRSSSAARFAGSVAGVASVAASLIFAMILLHRSTHEGGQAERNARLIARDDLQADRPHPDPSPADPIPPEDAPAARSFAYAPVAPAASPAAPPEPSAAPSPSAPAKSIADVAQGGMTFDRAGAGRKAELAQVDGPAAANRPAQVVRARAASPPLADADASVLADAKSGLAKAPARPDGLASVLDADRVVRALVTTRSVGEVSARVNALIERSTPLDARFGRIEVEPGVVVDPAQPREAEVFAVRIDEGQVDAFVAQLRRELAAVDDAEARVDLDAGLGPALVARLAEGGRATLVAGARPPGLGLAPDELPKLVASKRDAGSAGAAQFGEGDVTGDPLGRNEVTRQPREARVQPQAKGQSSAAAEGKAAAEQAAALADKPSREETEKAKARPAGPLTVLVWVTRPSPRPAPRPEDPR